MCGIVGFTQKGWTPERDRIRQATATLIHRGPDQQGVFLSPDCAIGATRLKILDLDHGDQPLRSADGDCVAALNGEIYNHLELRPELEALGFRFQTRCDTETLLYAFLAWDTGCFRRLRGMFAAALWQNSRRRLVLVRDRMGIKPLYVAKHGGDLLFGSELKALLVHPEIERRLSPEGLDCYLSLNYVPCPWTLIDGIEKLAPGHWLEWKDGHIRGDAYWQAPSVGRQDKAGGPPITLEAAREELDCLLSQSVREHLLSDVPLGVWLSGGIDSSTVLHYASAAGVSNLKTFSVTFRGRSFDETERIRSTVSRYGTDHRELDLNPEENLEEAIREFAFYSDEPTADAGALPVWFLSKLSRDNVTVALSGEGADELFAGYLTYRANRLASAARSLPEPLLRFGMRALRTWPASNEKISLEYKLKRFLEGCLLPAERAHVHWNGTFTEPEKRQLLNQELPGAMTVLLEDLKQNLPGGDGLSAYLAFDQRYFLADDILVKTDRMSMAHSIEVRPPFLDHRIVEFATRLPASLKLRGREQKVLLRETMKGKLPPAALGRRKVGLDIPAHDWLRGPLRELVTATLLDEAPGGLFRRDAIERNLRLHQERQINLGYQLWGLMILFLWMKRWQVALPGREPAVPLLVGAGAGASASRYCC